VRRELVNALHRGIPVVPVLVGGATLPPPDALPDDIQDLLRHQAVEIRDVSWQRDVTDLLASLRSERKASPRSPHRRVAAIATVAIVAAIAVGAVVLTQLGGSKPTPPPKQTPPCPVIESSPTSARSILPGRSYSPDYGTLRLQRFGVLDAHVRSIDSSHWWLYLHTKMTNNSKSATYHADYDYSSVAVDGTPYIVKCFGITAGTRVVDPNLNSEAVVGFMVGKNPAGALTLVFGDNGQLLIANAAG
jgi:hypothetical protein